MMGLEEDAMAESLDLMDIAAAEDEDTEYANAGKQNETEAGNVCAAMASIMSGLSVRVHIAGAIPREYDTSEKKPVHGQVARLRKEDQQLMEDVCTDACGCGCFSSIGTAICGGGGGGSGAGGTTTPCRRRLLHQTVANNHESCRTPPLHFENAFGSSHGYGTDIIHYTNLSSSSGSGSSGGGYASNVSTPRASTPSPLGIRTRSWSTAAADAAWDSAASIARTVSSSF